VKASSFFLDRINYRENASTGGHRKHEGNGGWFTFFRVLRDNVSLEAGAGRRAFAVESQLSAVCGQGSK